jgi:hypothetical protein
MMYQGLGVFLPRMQNPSGNANDAVGVFLSESVGWT